MTTLALLEALKKLGSQRIILFWGSGIVRELGYPSWEELLVRAADFAQQFEPTLAAFIRARGRNKKYFLAGDLLLGDEIPQAERANFLLSIFDKNPNLLPIHAQLAACPFASFITTNYDRTIEQALTANRKTPEAFAHSDRFSRYNSRLSVYSSGPLQTDQNGNQLDPQRLKNGLVLKLHGDITSPEDIVLGSSQLSSLMADEAFKQLYKRILSTYSLVFVGYSGNDPAFEWHCRTLLPTCGIPSNSSYLLHPDDETPPSWLNDASIISVPFSTNNGHKELSDFARELSLHFSKPDVISVPTPLDQLSDAKLVSLSFILVGLIEGQHSSGFQCAVNSMLAEAAISIGSLDKDAALAEYIARTYHLPFDQASQMVQRADKRQAQYLVDKHASADSNLQSRLSLLARGIADRARAVGVNYSDERARQIVMNVLVHSLSTYGNALALSLIDAEPPDTTLVDKVVRGAINLLSIPGIGPLDKELLSTCFADLFIHPSVEEANCLLLLAQVALAHALATTFSGGLKSLSELLPSEAYLDSNVAIPLVAKDHPRSSYYNELIVRLMRSDCSIFMLDLFLDEMVNHCRRAHEEVAAAVIKTVTDAKNYADFHGILWINAFLAAYANGGVDNESFEGYLVRMTGSAKPNESHFRMLLTKLGVEVVSTNHMNKSLSVSLATHIAWEKGRLMRLKAQVLADHEAVQIQWLHDRHKIVSWFITEDIALRRILRELPSVTFSKLAPSKGVVPAQGAFLILTTLADRPSLQGSFVQFLWNPLYVELVDSKLASVIRKMPDHFKKLKQTGFADIRERIIHQMQRELERTDRDDILRRVKEYKLGRPTLVDSILKALGEKPA